MTVVTMVMASRATHLHGKIRNWQLGNSKLQTKSNLNWVCFVCENLEFQSGNTLLHLVCGGEVRLTKVEQLNRSRVGFPALKRSQRWTCQLSRVLHFSESCVVFQDPEWCLGGLCARQWLSMWVCAAWCAEIRYGLIEINFGGLNSFFTNQMFVVLLTL